MMMNSSVYAGRVCPQQPPVVDYGGEPQIFYGDVGTTASHQHYGYSEPPNSHLPHQIIEPNSLSYTNLDAGAYNSHHRPYYPQPSEHFYRMFEYDSGPETYHAPSYQRGGGNRTPRPTMTTKAATSREPLMRTTRWRPSGTTRSPLPPRRSPTSTTPPTSGCK